MTPEIQETIDYIFTKIDSVIMDPVISIATIVLAAKFFGFFIKLISTSGRE